MLDKASYHTTNASSREIAFEYWFIAYEQDLENIATREEFSDDEESDKQEEGHKEDEVGEFEIPLKKIEAQKSRQKRLRIPKKRIREKSAVPRKPK